MGHTSGQPSTRRTASCAPAETRQTFATRSEFSSECSLECTPPPILFTTARCELMFIRYHAPSKSKGRETWEPNLAYFARQFDGHPERVKNLHFAFVVLLRALSRASPHLEAYPYSTGVSAAEDVKTAALVSGHALSRLPSIGKAPKVLAITHSHSSARVRRLSFFLHVRTGASLVRLLDSAIL
eukprot:scaffold910_cov30-Tisochrysis_lutea.AAC.4